MESTPTVTINGVVYDTTKMTEEAYALIQDLGTIQSELNRLKVSFDITGIARNAILAKTDELITSGKSGLVMVDQEAAGQETTNTPAESTLDDAVEA